MIIRRYTGANTQEALLKVKMDLGMDAFILNTKKVKKKGIIGFFSKPLIEVMASIDEINKSKIEKVKVQQPAPIQNEPDKNVLKDEKLDLLDKRISGLEGILNKVYEKMSLSSKNIDNNESKNEDNNYEMQFYNNLIFNDVEPEIANYIITSIKEKGYNGSSISEAATLIYNHLYTTLGKPETIKLREDGKPTIVIFIGPTGVGKTTTLAKLAAQYTLEQKKKVGLITLDTYRISAVDQLKTYADIMNLPLSVIYSCEEVLQAINDFSDKDLILLDTAGRSFKDKTQFEEIKKLEEATGTSEIFLVVSASTSNKNMREIIKNYSCVANFKVIITKLDESMNYGIVLNTRFLSNKPLSYVTTGQNVPDDIELIDINKISHILMGSIK